MKILIGTDAECFLLHDESANFVASQGIIEGTKDFPFPIPGLGDGFATQRDNVALEFNIPPASSEEEFINNLEVAKQAISSMLPNGMRMSFTPSVIFADDQLFHPEAMTFGCDPDFDAWRGRMNKIANIPIELSNLRAAGGHIHFGYEDPDNEVNRIIIKSCDLHLGVPSILMDTDTSRKILYGKAGAFRNKPYGCEYRTLSNFWLRDQNLSAWAYRNAVRAFNDAVNGVSINDERIVEAINTSNKGLAMELVKEYELEVLN